MQNIENERMNNLPSVKGLYDSKKILNESISNDTLVNGMIIDQNNSDNEKSNPDMKCFTI